MARGLAPQALTVSRVNPTIESAHKAAPLPSAQAARAVQPGASCQQDKASAAEWV